MASGWTFAMPRYTRAMSASASVHRHAPDWIVLTIACVAQFMVVLDVSIVNVALPSMQRDLHFSMTNAQWVVNAYVITFAGFLLLGGRAADIFGRRHIYLGGLALFTLASVGAGFAQTGTELIAVRALQGLGGAVLSPATLTIILTTFHGPRLPKAIGAWSAVAGAGGAVGGLLGGLLTGWFSWRWVFFINVPFGIGAALLALTFLRELRNREASHKLDLTGALLVTVSLAAAVYGVVTTATTGWGDVATLAWIVGGVAGIVLFVFWESRVATNPLVALRIFHSRAVSTANLVMFLVGGSFFAMWYFLTFYYQYILGYGAVKTGFAFLPMAVAIVGGAQLSSRLIGRFGVRHLLAAGTASATIGFLWIAMIGVHSPYETAILVPSVLCAFAIGLLFTPLATAATSGVDRADAGLASGVLNASRQVGGSLALAALGTVAADRSASFAHPNSPVALVNGYQWAFHLSAGITLLALVVSLAVPHGRPETRVVAPPLVSPAE